MSPTTTLRTVIVPSMAVLLLGGTLMAQQGAPAGDRKPGARPDDGARSLSPSGPSAPRQAPTRGDMSPTQTQPGAANVARDVTVGDDLDTAAVLRFEPAELDLGELAPDRSKSGMVKIVNISDQPVTITRAIASCGCTTPVWPRDPIPPGGSGEMEITLKAGAKAGVTLVKNVTLQLDGGHAPVRYVLRGTVPEYVRIAPDIVEAPGSSERPVSNIITLTSVDGTPFRVTSVTPPIIMTEDARSASGTAALEHTLRIDWDKWTEAGRPFRAQFATDHPKASSLAAMIRRPIDRSMAAQDPDSPLFTGNRPPTAPAAQRPAPAGVVFAAQRGDRAEVERRLAAGDDPNAHDPQSLRTALHWAARNNNVELIDVLLENGADVRVVERMGRQALALAAESGSVDAMNRLIAAKADVNARDEYGGSPVLWASGLGSPEAVQLLIDAGADPNIQDSNGMTPLMWAATLGNPRSVAVLASTPGIRLDSVDVISAETALMRAARNGKAESVKILIDHGAKVDAKNQQGMTPFLFACATGNLDSVKAVLEGKPDIAVTDPRGRNALDFASARTETEGKRIAEFLSSELKLKPSGTVAASPASGDAAKGS
ncbi:MAG: ankyrin repeat domain-containing protein [Phycisphaeraceae bacterium]|nr:ankyrin repeat domain-containing protein [Phycisphaeraceae bacterium]